MYHEIAATKPGAIVVGVVVVLERRRVAPKIHVSYGPRMTIDLVGQRIGILRSVVGSTIMACLLCPRPQCLRDASIRAAFSALRSLL